MSQIIATTQSQARTLVSDAIKAVSLFISPKLWVMGYCVFTLFVLITMLPGR